MQINPSSDVIGAAIIGASIGVWGGRRFARKGGRVAEFLGSADTSA